MRREKPKKGLVVASGAGLGKHRLIQEIAIFHLFIIMFNYIGLP